MAYQSAGTTRSARVLHANQHVIAEEQRAMTITQEHTHLCIAVTSMQLQKKIPQRNSPLLLPELGQIMGSVKLLLHHRSSTLD